MPGKFAMVNIFFSGSVRPPIFLKRAGFCGEEGRNLVEFGSYFQRNIEEERSPYPINRSGKFVLDKDINVVY